MKPGGRVREGHRSAARITSATAVGPRFYMIALTQTAVRVCGRQSRRSPHLSVMWSWISLPVSTTTKLTIPLNRKQCGAALPVPCLRRKDERGRLSCRNLNDTCTKRSSAFRVTQLQIVGSDCEGAFVLSSDNGISLNYSLESHLCHL